MPQNKSAWLRVQRKKIKRKVEFCYWLSPNKPSSFSPTNTPTPTFSFYFLQFTLLLSFNSLSLSLSLPVPQIRESSSIATPNCNLPRRIFKVHLLELTLAPELGSTQPFMHVSELHLLLWKWSPLYDLTGSVFSISIQSYGNYKLVNSYWYV